MTEQVAGRALPRVLAGVLAVVVLTGACSADPVGGEPGPGTRAVPTAPGAAQPGVDSVPAAPAVAVDAGAAPDSAVALLEAYVRTDLDHDTWLAGVAPLLSPTAAEAAVGTDPAQVPATAVTGDPVVLPSGSTWLALVDVPTDIGAVRVLLSWDEVAGRWSGERITWETSP